METLKKIVYWIVVFLVIDFLCLIAWAYSGQRPEGQVYLGSVSAHIIDFIIKK